MCICFHSLEAVRHSVGSHVCVCFHSLEVVRYSVGYSVWVCLHNLEVVRHRVRCSVVSGCIPSVKVVKRSVWYSERGCLLFESCQVQLGMAGRRTVWYGDRVLCTSLPWNNANPVLTRFSPLTNLKKKSLLSGY